MQDFFDNLFQNYIQLPQYVKDLALLAGVLAAAFRWMLQLLSRKHRTEKTAALARNVAGGMLVTYLTLMFSSTVFARIKFAEHRMETELFWSYKKIYEGYTYYLWEDLYNVIMLIPVGILFPASFGKGIKQTVAAGFLCSVLIEVLQLFLKRGLFEFDDIFHNTIGTFLGFGLFALCRKICILLHSKTHDIVYGEEK